MRPPRRRPAALLAAAALVLAGCAGGPGGAGTRAAASGAPMSSVTSAPSPGTSAAVRSSVEPSGTTGAMASPSPFPADLRPDTAEPVDAAGLTVTAVRAAAHEGFDRVVFELAGDGLPGWDVRYVDSAATEGTGDPVDLAGPAYLRVLLRGTSYPYETGAAEVRRGPVAGNGTRAVTGTFYDGTFEGQSVAFIGVAARTPFRVYALSGPARVVVELAAP